jgi:hypothetical protein
MKSDGYYFRDEDGDVHGPMTHSQFTSAERNGSILPGVKAWRTQGGAIFTVVVKRRFLPRNMFSASASNNICDLVIICSGLFMLLFLFSIPQLRDDIIRNMRTQIFSTVFLFVTVIATLVLTYVTIRQKARQLSRATTTIEHSEV